MCQGREDWTRALPMILLGLRTAYREDLQSSSAELVYGENIRVPSQLIEDKKVHTHQSEFAKELRDHFERIRPAPPSRHANQKIFVSPELNKCTQVFIRTDLCKRSLQPPYEGPFPVIKREEKAFLVNIRGRHSNISIDRLKPCYHIDETEETTRATHPTSESETQPAEQQHGNTTQTATAFGSPTAQSGTGTRQTKVTFNLKQQASANSKPSHTDSNKKSCLKGKNITTIPVSTTRAGRQTKAPARFTDCVHREIHWQGCVW